MSDVVLLIAGLALLIVGGELLVRGAVGVAERLGMSPLLIGLTLVGFGTSTPELVTSVEAAMIGSPGIAIGNVVGSNIANVLLILGASALISPIAVGSGALARDGVAVLGVAVLFAAIGFLLPLDRIVGTGLVLGLIGYIWLAWLQESRDGADGHTAAYEKAEAFDELHDGPIRHQLEAKRWADRVGILLPLAMAIGGLALVVLGGKQLVGGAVGLARNLGISETVIGLTIVAVGTSMPELVTSLVAAYRRHSDVALGNVMGSSIYNILGIGGTTALLSPTVVPPEIASFDNLVMVASSLALLVLAHSGRHISRIEGAALLVAYAVYVYALLPK
ncbi:MAG: calcium/sodium antiporter [Pseudomonadota bacterium]